MAWVYHNKPPMGWPLDLSEPINDGIVGYWLLNEGSGNKVFDLSGNGNTGTILGGDVIWAPGKFGSALSFPGTAGDYIDCGTGLGSILGSSNEGISTSMWFKTNRTEVPTNDGLYYLGTFAGAQGEFAAVIFNDTILLLVDRLQKGNIAFTDTTSWHHYVSTYDGVRAKQYLDNVLVTNIAYSAVLDFTNLKTIIGGYFDDGIFTFDGLIDDVLIYNRALSASKIALLYQFPFYGFLNPDEIPVLDQYYTVAVGTILPQITSAYMRI